MMKKIASLFVSAALVFAVSCSEKEPQVESNRPTGNGSDKTEDTTPPETGELETFEVKTFTQGNMEFWGVSYEDQPETSNNWCITLAEESFDLMEWSGTGYSVVLELFTTDVQAETVPLGNYTVEAFEKEMYSDYSVGDGFVYDDEDAGESYCMGTWIFEDGTGLFAADEGSVKVSKSGDTYTVTYDLTDLEEGVNFKGSYTGPLEFVDLTKSKSAVVGNGRRPAHVARLHK